MKISRLLVLILLLLGACAQPAAQATPPASQPPAPTQMPPAAPTDTPSAAPEPSPTLPVTTPLTLTDGLSRTIQLQAPAQRIVSMAPSNTEILFAIGAGDLVVGRDSFSDYPQEAAQIADIGGGYGDWNNELIVSLKPDLVLAAAIIAPEEVQALEKLGLKAFLLPNPTTFDGLYANLQVVGQLSGRESQASALVEQLKGRVTTIESKIGTVAERPSVFYEIDGSDPNAPWTAGPGTFVDTLINTSGGVNIGSALSSDWAQISLEELVTKDPDYILLGDYTWGGVTPEAVKARSGWGGLSAVKNDRVFTFDDNLVSRPGPRMVDGLEAMAKLLHPELFK